jgi:hypothetical protein
LLTVFRSFMNVANSVLWRIAIILKANKVNLFVSSVLFVFWYHSPNFLDTPRSIESVPVRQNSRGIICLGFSKFLGTEVSNMLASPYFSAWRWGPIPSLNCVILFIWSRDSRKSLKIEWYKNHFLHMSWSAIQPTASELFKLSNILLMLI